MSASLHELATDAMVKQLHLEIRVADSTRFWLISRIKDDEWRRQMELGDGWQIHKMYKDENSALGDLIYLNNSAALRTYALFAELPSKDGSTPEDRRSKPWNDDTLDDDIPF